MSVTPVKYVASDRVHRPFAKGDVLPPGTIPLSTTDGNQLEIDATGLLMPDAALEQATPYYPKLLSAPAPHIGRKPWFGDIQNWITWGTEANGHPTYYRAVLFTEDYDTEKATGWQVQVSHDNRLTWSFYRNLLTPDMTPYGSIATGSWLVNPMTGKIVIYTTFYGGQAPYTNQCAGRWEMDSIDAEPVFKGIFIQNPYLGQNPVPADAVNRDPRVVWFDNLKLWVLAIARIGGIQIYTSSDPTLEDDTLWIEAGFVALSDYGTVECPTLFRMAAADATMHDVLMFGGNPYASGHTSAPWYLVGTFTGGAFDPDALQPADWSNRTDFGPDAYPPAISMDNALVYSTTCVMNWGYYANLPTTNFQGTIATEKLLTLAKDSTGAYALSTSVRTADETRYPKSFTLPDQTLTPPTPPSDPVAEPASPPDNGLDPGTGPAGTPDPTIFQLGGGYLTVLPEAFQLDFTLSVPSGQTPPKTTGLYLSDGGTSSFALVFDLAAGEIRMSRLGISTVPFGADGPSWYNVYRYAFGAAPVQASFKYDHGIGELLINGKTSMTMQTFPAVACPYGVIRISSDGQVTVSAVTMRYAEEPFVKACGFTRTDADGKYLFNDYPGITSFGSDYVNQIFQEVWDHGDQFVVPDDPLDPATSGAVTLDSNPNPTAVKGLAMRFMGMKDSDPDVYAFADIFTLINAGRDKSNALTEAIKELRTEVADLKAQVAALTTRVTTLEGEMTQAQTDIKTVEGDVTTINTRIDGDEKRITVLENTSIDPETMNEINAALATKNFAKTNGSLTPAKIGDQT